MRLTATNVAHTPEIWVINTSISKAANLHQHHSDALAGMHKELAKSNKT
jgi:hypothetical protein